MTHSPDPNTQPPDPNSTPEPVIDRRSRRLLRRAVLILGGVLLVGGAGATAWAWWFIHNRLVPIVSESLVRLVNRPVEIGEVERFTLTSLRLGPSALPPTDTDADQLTLDAIEVQFNPLEYLFERQLTLDLSLVRPQLFLDQTEDGAWVALELTPSETESPIKLDEIFIQDGSAVLQPFPWAQVSAETPDSERSPLQIPIQSINGDLSLRNQNKFIAFDIAGKPVRGGSIAVRGEADLENDRFNMLVQSNSLLATDIGALVRTPLAFQAGLLDTNLTIGLNLDNLRSFDLNGTARIRNLVADVNGLPKPITDGNGRLRFAGQVVTLEETSAQYGEITAIANGDIDLNGGYDLAVRLPGVTVEQVQNTLEVESPIAASGEFQANAQITGTLQQPIITGAIINNGTVVVDRLSIEELGTRFAFKGSDLTVSDFRVLPSDGGEITGDGSIRFGADGGLVFDIVAQGLPADAIARAYSDALPDNVTIGAVDANLQLFGPLSNPNQIQAVLDWDAPGGTYPSQGQVLYANSLVQLRDGVVQVAGGSANVEGEVSLVERRWRSIVQAADIQLNQFSTALTGLLNANVNLSGTLDDFSLAGIRADGQASFSEGLSLLDRPLDTQFAWLGDRLEIRDATAPGFQANGVILTQLENQGAAKIAGLNLNVALQDYDLTPLQAYLPSRVQQQVRFAGLADFQGRVTGTGTAPQINGNLAFNDLVINRFAFDSVLAGEVAFALDRGLNLDVRGEQDRIAVTLDNRFLPTAFYVQNGEAIAQAETENDRLVGTLENFDVAVLDYAPGAQQGLGAVRGVVNASFIADINDLSDPSVVAQVAIARPGIDYINADSLTGEISYIDGVAALTQGELLFGTSRYLLDGRFDRTNDPQLRAEIVADQGNLQDVLLALQIFEIQDFSRGLRPPNYAEGSQVTPVAIDMSRESLMNQLRRLSEIIALQEQQAQEAETAILPPLEKLEGTFDGTIDLTASQQSGLNVDFNLQGENWRWDEYTVDSVTAIGDFQDGVLALLPLRFVSGDGFVNVTGQIGGDQQSAQIIAENVSVAAIRDIANLPLDINGTLNANAIISGSLANPQATGAIEILNGSLNNTRIREAGVRLSYSDARLNFIGNMTAGGIKLDEGVVVRTPEPLNVRGSIPYAFPFMAIDPASLADEPIQLNVSVRDDGIALMNLFTDQITWEGGTGEVQLDVSGTRSNPLALGTIRVSDTTFSLAALPDRLTNVSGQVNFNRDRIVVENLSGQYGDGQLVARGFLPIAVPVSSAIEVPLSDEIFEQPLELPESAESPLLIGLDNLDLEYKEQFEGTLDGRILLSGSVLAPRIGGNVRITDGQLSLNQPEAEASQVAQENARAGTSVFLPPELRDFRLLLDDNVQITRNQPDINMVATGSLIIDGPFGNLQPTGVVQLERGYVNIILTQFNLTGPTDEHPQTAVFRPENGLDPFLDIRLTALVPEVVQPPTISSTSPFAASEVADPTFNATDFGTVQTVRIQATVEAPASSLLQELELSSDPARTQNEIVALIGGGTLSALQQGQGTLAIANLAGSALLSNLQNLIGNVLGLSDFRLFPTEVISEESGASTLGLGAEVGFNITDNLSASILQVITADDLTQFGLRYRINDEFSVRGSMTLEGDRRVLLEYRSTF